MFSVSTPNSVKQAHALLHFWRETLDEASERIADPAHLFRISALSEAIRLMADALDAHPKSVRRECVADLSALLVRMAKDIEARPADEDEPMFDVSPYRETEAKIGPVATSMLSISRVLESVFEDGGETTPSGVIDLAAAGRVDYRNMKRWANGLIDALEDIDVAVLRNPAFAGASFVPLHRDAQGARTRVVTVAAAMADCNLVEIERLAVRIVEAGRAVDRAERFLTSHAMLRPGMATECEAGRLALRGLDGVLAQGASLLADARTRREDDRYVVAWRILARGRASFADYEIADMLAGAPGLPQPILIDDLAGARALGAAAHAVRDEWVA